MDRLQSPDGTADRRRRRDGRRRRSDVVWAAALCFLIAMPLTLIDPPYLERATAQFSQRAYNLIFGAAYPDSWGLPIPVERAQRPEVAVALLNESAANDLAREGERAWPSEARIHAAVLEAILARKPRAVFVDLLFIDRMVGSTAAFERAVARFGTAHGTTTPLYFVLGSMVARPGGVALGEPCSCSQARQARLQGVATQPETSVTGELWRLVEAHAWVNLIGAPLPEDQVVLRSYPLSAQHAALGCTPTAAVCLYEAATGASLPPDRPDLFLFWELEPPDANDRWMECSPPLKGWVSWLPRPVLAFFSPESLKQRCATIPTIPVKELLQSEQDADVQSMIEGNVVLYGANVTGGDLHPTLVTDSISGVYIHAMALDNLLKFGDRYIKSERRFGIPIRTDDVSIVVAALVATLMAVLVATGMPMLARCTGWEWLGRLDELSGFPGFVASLVLDVVVGIVAAFLTIPISMVLVRFLSLAPLNWLAVAALTALTREFVQRRAGEHIVEAARALLSFVAGIRKRGAAG